MLVDRCAVSLFSLMLLPLIKAAEFCVGYKNVSYGCDAEIVGTDLRGAILNDIRRIPNATVISSRRVCDLNYVDSRSYGSSRFAGSPFLRCEATAAFNSIITSILKKNTDNLSGFNSDGVFAVILIAAASAGALAAIACYAYKRYQRSQLSARLLASNVSFYGATDMCQVLIQDRSVEMQPVKTAEPF
ncbi:MAG: hypothetical protein P1U63_04480 [Coxiellaceae bacterium]|nr:hypothetical protein [Coxiellaceae bacterium]